MSELCRAFELGPPDHVAAIRDVAEKLDVAGKWLGRTYWTSYVLLADSGVGGASDGLYIVMRDDIDTPVSAAVIWLHEYAHVCAWQRGGYVAHGHTWVFAAIYAYFLARLNWLEPVRPIYAEMVHHCEHDQLFPAWADGVAVLGPSWSMSSRAASFGGRCWSERRLRPGWAMDAIIQYYNDLVHGFDRAALLTAA